MNFKIFVCIFCLTFLLEISIQAEHKKWVPEEIQNEKFIENQRELSGPQSSTNTLPIIKVRQIKSSGEKATRFEIPISNSTVILKKGMKRVELICSSSYPIKFEYLVNDISIPILEVKYRRVFQFNESGGFFEPDELKKAEQNTFEGRVILRGLLESQTGTYSCRFFNGKLSNNSYHYASNISIFIPGKRIFNAISHIKYVKASDTSLVISCPVSDPEIQVDLYKLNEVVFNQTNLLEWDKVFNSAFSPLSGFILQTDNKEQSLFGTYKCIANAGVPGREKILTIHVADSEFKDTVYDSVLQNKAPCWENLKCMKLMRSKRLECFCKNSYGLFINNEDGDEENRKGRCSNFINTLKEFSNITNGDWRIDEFMKNGEDGPNSCFRDEIRENFNGTGARVILRTSKMIGILNDSSNSSTLVNLTITFDGLPDWASGFKIGVEPSINETATVTSNKQINSISILNKEPTSTQLYPQAHYTAVWKNFVVDVQQVHRIHIYQPDSFSFDWFQISSLVNNSENVTLSEDVCENGKMACISTSFIMQIIVGSLGVLIVIIALVCLFVIFCTKQTVKYYPCEKLSFANPNFE